ncbi:MAG: hypothetical protein HYZ46_02875 [Nitrosomonadales bacterium]|nr:hypothetical protein [Nitrosomonadales bacterium]
MQGIDYVAWWGAVVATLVFLWDVAKWFKSGPKIRQRIQPDIFYPDSKVLSVEKSGNGESKELAAYCHIELVNTGTLPTTIMGISATHKRNGKFGQMSFDNQSFTPHYGKTLPYVLSPGEVWSCRLEMSGLHKLAEWGRPYIEVTVSHKRSPVVIWPKMSANKANLGDAKKRCA